MRKWILTSLLALPLLGLCQDRASAFFSICGEYSAKYRFNCPRIIFGIDCGPCENFMPRPVYNVCPPPPCYPPPCAGVPAYQAQQHAMRPPQAPVPPQAPPPGPGPSMMPVSYQQPAPTGYYYTNYPQQTSGAYQYGTPMYWYGR